MSQLRGPVIDADNHFYEVEDTFTRHLPAEMRRRLIEAFPQEDSGFKKARSLAVLKAALELALTTPEPSMSEPVQTTSARRVAAMVPPRGVMLVVGSVRRRSSVVDPSRGSDSRIGPAGGVAPAGEG